MKNVTDILIDKIEAMHNPTVAGLDTRVEHLPESMKKQAASAESAAKAIAEYNRALIDALCDIVPAVKIQSAYYEMHGYHGVKAFFDTAEYAASKGMCVMADVKRNDIGATAEAYAAAYLGPQGFDYVTVNPYPGFDGIKPFTDKCRENNKGIFVLARMSNPSAAQIQNLKLESGETIYSHIGELIREWGADQIGEYGYSSVGAVVGATSPEEAKLLRERYKTVFFLVPGYGAQGGKGEGAAASFDSKGRGAIVNNSRGIIAAHQSEKYKGMTPAAAARAAAIDMQQDLEHALKNRK